MTPFNRFCQINTRGNLWIYILFLLKERPLYGYEIPKLIKERFGFRPGKITPYAVLYRLEFGGFCKSEVKERRRIYQITQKGKEELEKAKNFWQEISEKLLK